MWSKTPSQHSTADVTSLCISFEINCALVVYKPKKCVSCCVCVDVIRYNSNQHICDRRNALAYKLEKAHNSSGQIENTQCSGCFLTLSYPFYTELTSLLFLRWYYLPRWNRGAVKMLLPYLVHIQTDVDYGLASLTQKVQCVRGLCSSPMRHMQPLLHSTHLQSWLVTEWSLCGFMGHKICSTRKPSWDSIKMEA